jgi:galactose mutarotase-like enzyme
MRMPAITVEQRQYKTYILTNSEARLEVVPERGGIVISWQVQNQEMFYLDAERFTHPDLSVRGGIPILFPICGNLPDDSYSYGGQAYKLKQHGFARELPWQAQETTADHAALTLVLESNPQTLETYPFEFQLAFTYELQGRSLLLTQRHSNRSDRPMPISTGLHPYFTVTDKSQLQVEIPASHYQEKSNPTPQPFAGFNFEQDEIDQAFRPLSQQSSRVIDRQRQLSLQLDYDSNYTTLVFWTVKGKDFYCLEPWSAPRNAINTGEDLLIVAPHSSLETQVKFTVDFL